MYIPIGTGPVAGCYLMILMGFFKGALYPFLVIPSSLVLVLVVVVHDDSSGTGSVEGLTRFFVSCYICVVTSPV